MFKELYSLLNEEVALNLTVSKTKGKLTVSVHLSGEKIKDPALKKLKPFHVTDLPENLDREFITLITHPVESTVQLVTDVSDYENHLKEIRDKTEMVKKQDTTVSPPKPNITMLMKKVEEHIKKREFKEAMETCDQVLQINPDHTVAKRKKRESEIQLSTQLPFGESVQETALPKKEIAGPKPQPNEEKTVLDMFAAACEESELRSEAADQSTKSLLTSFITTTQEEDEEDEDVLGGFSFLTDECPE